MKLLKCIVFSDSVDPVVCIKMGVAYYGIAGFILLSLLNLIKAQSECRLRNIPVQQGFQEEQVSFVILLLIFIIT